MQRTIKLSEYEEKKLQEIHNMTGQSYSSILKKRLYEPVIDREAVFYSISRLSMKIDSLELETGLSFDILKMEVLEICHSLNL